ncbi:MAG: hypothetical protein ABIW82_06695 [Dokdonella sp.]
MPIIGQNNLGTIAAYNKATQAFPNAKRALCFGDSWFQYPPRPIDLNKLLAKAFRNTLFMSEGVAGRDSAQWKVALPRIQREIGTFQFDAILLSNGGNDIVGEEMQEFVKTASQAQSAGTNDWGVIPGEVFDHVRLETFQHALEYTIKDLKEIIQYRDRTSPNSIIYVHTYDYIYPDGKPFKLGPITVGPWVKPALDGVGLTVLKDQRIVTGWLLDQFARSLKAFASQTPNMRVIDSLGTLTSPKQWANEIHPTAKGFAAIANGSWIPALAGVLA